MRMYKLSVLLIYLTCLSCLQLQANNLINYTLVDAETGKPIELARVESAIASTYSNSDGEFNLPIDSTGKITILHLSYGMRSYYEINFSDTIALKQLPYELGEVVITPHEAMVRELRKVWNKYAKISKKKAAEQNFFYRQLVTVNGVHTEYEEALFTGRSSYSTNDFSLWAGRFARIDSLGDMALTVFYDQYRISQASPFSIWKSDKKGYWVAPLCKDFDKAYYISLKQIIMQETEEEIRVYELTPKIESFSDPKVLCFSACLFIRVKDSAIMRAELWSDKVKYQSINKVSEQKRLARVTITINYQDGESLCPMVESVQTSCSPIFIHKGNICKYEIHTTLTAINIEEPKTGKKMKKTDNLLHESWHLKNNDLSIFDNNSIIKRTAIEQKAVDDFSKKGKFDNFGVGN